ncbi:MAG TPA: hypothetical protein VFG54_10180 [Prolixibacteraceae bacterium]|nr:hypothetical protein [Prolixibacteraceae bacterium]
MRKEKLKIIGLFIGSIISLLIGLYLVQYINKLDSHDNFKEYNLRLKEKSTIIRTSKPISTYQDFFGFDYPGVTFRLEYPKIDDSSWDIIDKSIKLGDTIKVVVLSKDYENAKVNRHIGCVDIFELSKNDMVFLSFDDKINSKKRRANISVYTFFLLGFIFIVFGVWKIKNIWM